MKNLKLAIYGLILISAFSLKAETTPLDRAWEKLTQHPTPKNKQEFNELRAQGLKFGRVYEETHAIRALRNQLNIGEQEWDILNNQDEGKMYAQPFPQLQNLSEQQ